jgi:amino acid adenylation domain-containing protein
MVKTDRHLSKSTTSASTPYSLIESQAQQISQLPILSAVERHQLVVDRNQTQRDFPNNVCIHQLFEAQVKKTPDAIALTCENQSLTYQELNRRANQLAHHLRFLNVQSEQLVGICLERSPEAIVALLGILKAGAACVPLDPAYPQERLTTIQQEADLSLIVTQSSLTQKFANSSAQTLEIAALSHSFETQDPQTIATSQQLVYVLFTSGSTGKPKGVMIEHRSLVNFILGMRDELQVTEHDRFLQSALLGFDVSMFEIFLPLTSGAQLCMATAIQRRDPKQLSQLMQQENVTIAALPPALLPYLDPTILPELRLVCVGGEASSGEQIQRWTAAIPQVFNGYGPTEATVAATQMLCKKQEPKTPPIGKPLPNYQVFVLDDQQQLVPIGIPGELHIGGIGLARGYLNRPDLTAERFIPHPFSDVAGARLYKTGDRVRWLPDGNLEFLGRVDHQVKLRGFRIELGEIEAALIQYSGVRDCLVMLREDHPGNPALVAYVVAESISDAVAAPDLAHFLKRKLPDYMVPSAFVWLESLPLTPNGKVDRRALPTPEIVSPQGTAAPPQTDLEHQLTQIWQTVLGVRNIGIHDNFFDLGGHSLLAVRLLTQIEQALQRSLPLMTLLQAPTIQQLAEILSQEASKASVPCLVPIRSEGSKPPLFCIHAIGGSPLFYQNLLPYLDDDRPLYALQPLGSDGKQTPLTQVEEMAALYLQEIQTLQPQGPYFLAGYSFGGLVAFEIARQLQAQGHSIAFLALIDTVCPTLTQPDRPLPRHQLLSLYWRNFWRIQPKHRLDYLVASVTWKVQYLQSRFSHRSSALPAYLVSIEAANYRARNTYQPQAHATKITTKVTLFRSPFPQLWNVPLDLGWAEFASDIEICNIYGIHKELMNNPLLKTWGEQFKARLAVEDKSV